LHPWAWLLRGPKLGNPGKCPQVDEEPCLKIEVLTVFELRISGNPLLWMGKVPHSLVSL